MRFGDYGTPIYSAIESMGVLEVLKKSLKVSSLEALRHDRPIRKLSKLRVRSDEERKRVRVAVQCAVEPLDNRLHELQLDVARRGAEEPTVTGCRV